MRYADARMSEWERAEIYRVYVSEHLRATVGSDLRYCDLVAGGDGTDFDAGQVVDDVVSRMGLEEE